MKYSIRKISFEDQSPVAKAFFEFAFPGFFYKPGSDEALDKYLAKGGFDVESFRKLQIPAGFSKHLPRRFAGDAFEYEKKNAEYDLPRQRYGSLICPDGTDHRILVSELWAYAGMGKTPFLLIDSFDQDMYSMLGFNAGSNEIIAVLEPNGFTVRFINFIEKQKMDLRSGGIALTDTGWIIINLQCRNEIVDLNNVMDLRLPSCREDFYRSYYQGVSGYITWPRCRDASFPEMLPFLYFQSLGGSIIHEAIGAHLRLNGYDGLIYPSARSDCYAKIVNGALSDFSGFSLVIYKDAPIPAAPKSPMLSTYCPWTTRIMPCNNFNAKIGVDVSKGSLYVSGIWEMANNNRKTKGYYFNTNPSSSSASLDILRFRDPAD